MGNDIGQSLYTSTYRARGHISAGGQYHFYMETQTATASSVDGDNIEVTCGSQYPTLYQGQIATILGVPLNKVMQRAIHLLFQSFLFHSISCRWWYDRVTSPVHLPKSFRFINAT